MVASVRRKHRLQAGGNGRAWRTTGKSRRINRQHAKEMKVCENSDDGLQQIS